MPRKQLSYPLFALGIMLVAQLACSQGATEAPTMAAATVIAADIPPIILWHAAEQTVQRIQPANGTSQRWELARVGSVGQILSQPHLLINTWLISAENTYFEVADGLPAPNQLWLAYGADAALHLSRIDGTDSRMVAPGGHSPYWSPQSDQFVYTDAEGVHLYDLASGASQLRWSDMQAEVLAWAPHHPRLLYRSGNKVGLFDLSSGQQTTLTLRGNQLHGYPIWSPDGTTLYAQYGRGYWLTYSDPLPVRAPLVAIDIGSGKVRQLLPSDSHTGVLDFALSPDGAFLAAWYATCHTRLNQLMPIPERACTHSIVVTATDGTGWHLVTELATAVGGFRPLQVAWQTWQAPMALTDEPPAVTAIAQPTRAFVAPTPTAPGHSIFAPLPYAETGVSGRKSFRVQDVLYGQAALDYASAAAITTQLLPPIADADYMAVLVETSVTTGSLRVDNRSVKLLDDRLAAYTPDLVVDASGRETRFGQAEIRAKAGTVTIGFVVVMPTDRQAAALFMSGIYAEDPDLYLSLGQDVQPAIVDAAELTGASNTLGAGEPAAVGVTAITEEWQVTVLEQLQDDAVRSLGIMPLFAPEQQAVVAKVRLRYTGRRAPFQCILNRTFTGIEGTQVIQPPYQLALPINHVQRVCLLPGGLWEGWLLLGVAKNEHSERKATATFGFMLDENERLAQRYFSIPSSP